MIITVRSTKMKYFQWEQFVDPFLEGLCYQEKLYVFPFVKSAKTIDFKLCVLAPIVCCFHI